MLDLKLVLGLDGLDYNLVKRFDCSCLMQKQFGEYAVPINPSKGVPLSPEVWASVLSGTMVEGGSLEFVVDSPLGQKWGSKLTNLLVRVRRHIPLSLGLGRKVSRVHGYPPCSLPFWLDAPDWFKLNVPFRDYDERIFQLAAEWNQGLTNYDRFIERVGDLFWQRKIQVMDAVPTMKGFSKAFVYLDFPDSLQHAFGSSLQQFQSHYEELNQFVTRFLSLLKPETCLILSDHGFDLEKQTHSNFGFYSCTESVSLKDASDVAKIVASWR